MSDSRDDVQTPNTAPEAFAGMTSQALLELIARASTLTLKGVVKSARVSPEHLVQLLRILVDEKLISVEGENTVPELDQIVRELTSPTPTAPETLVCGVPASIVEQRRDLIQHLSPDLRHRNVTITRKGFGKAFAL